MAALVLVAGVVLTLAAGRVLLRNGQNDLPRLAKKVQPAVVTIIAYNGLDEALFQGSGFFVSPGGSLITNCHVLSQAVRAEVRTAEGRCYPVKGVVAVDRDWDLVVAAVAISPEGARGLSITPTVPEVGERVAVVGSPLGLEQTLSDGVVSAVRRTSGGDYLQISAPVSTGSSGSPVVNMKGEVVGVTALQVIKGQNLNFAVPGSRALALLQKAEAAGTAAMPLATLEDSYGSASRYLSRGQGYAGLRPGSRATAATRPAGRLQPALAGAFSGLGRPLGP
jgi:S1-C subfamily serine protease